MSCPFQLEEPIPYPFLLEQALHLLLQGLGLGLLFLPHTGQHARWHVQAACKHANTHSWDLRNPVHATTHIIITSAIALPSGNCKYYTEQYKDVVNSWISIKKINPGPDITNMSLKALFCLSPDSLQGFGLVHNHMAPKLNTAVFKISARPWTLTSKIRVGLASFPSLSYINFGKIVLWSGKFETLFEDSLKCCVAGFHKSVSPKLKTRGLSAYTARSSFKLFSIATMPACGC